MTRSLTAKQEKFCQLVAAGSSASEAYRESYNAERMKQETIWRTAHELMSGPKVSARVKELQEVHAKRHAITVDDLVAELEEARQIAKDTEAPAAAVSATMGKGKLLGLVVERTDNKTTIDFSGMSDADLVALIASVAK